MRLWVPTIVVLFSVWFCGSALAAAPIETASSEVHLELWTWSMRPFFNAYCTDLIAAFERLHPGVQVRWIDVPDEAIVRKYFAAGAAGQLPDVVTLPDKVFLRFADLGGFQPLNTLLPGDPQAVYVAPALDQCRLGGKLLGLPWYLSTEILMVNPVLLAEGGLSPETLATHWDGLLEQARPFYRKTGKHLFTLRLGEIDLLDMIMAEGLNPIEPLASGRVPQQPARARGRSPDGAVGGGRSRRHRSA